MNKMDASIKSLTITGTAAEDASRSRRSVGSRKKRPTRQSEEEDPDFIEKVKEYSMSKQSHVQQDKPIIHISTQPAVLRNIEPRVTEPKVTEPRVTEPKVTEPKVTEPKVTEPRVTEPRVVESKRIESNPDLMSYSTHSIHREFKLPEQIHDGGAKVILKPAKNPRVKLQPKGVNQAAPQPTRSEPQTRKVRRIRLTVSSLNHRFTRAKRLKDDTEKKSISSIRDYLIQKGVIQEKSKAPEKMLRSMYRDFMLLKDTAL